MERHPHVPSPGREVRRTAQDDLVSSENQQPSVSRDLAQATSPHSSQSLRETSPSLQRPTPKSSRSQSLQRTARNRPQAWHGGPTGLDMGNVNRAALGQRSNGLRRQSLPHTPAISSPLNPTPLHLKNPDAVYQPPHGAEDYTVLRDTPFASRKAVAPVTEPDALPPSANRSTKPLRSSFSPPDLSQQDDSLTDFRLSSPQSVRDLGSDYTRYFNPFAALKPSQHDLRGDLSNYRLMSSTSEQCVTDKGPNRLSSKCSNPTLKSKRSSFFSGSTSVEPKAVTDNALSSAQLAAKLNKHESREKRVFANSEKMLLPPWLDDRLGVPNDGFPLMSDEKEADDDMHMPYPDDDIKMRPGFKDYFTSDAIVSTLGLVLMVSGMLCIFVVLPVISYSGFNLLPGMSSTPSDEMPEPETPADIWAHVNDRNYSLLANMRSGLIDSDTPEYARTRKGIDGDDMKLVFSDEFNRPNRTFYDEDDPYWYGFDGWYGATQDLEWYDPDAINTGDGTLQLQLDAFRNHNLDFRSGMLHSWNKLCFKGGIFEVSMSLPGPAGVHGLWPGVWSMGNLGRPGYLATTDGMWPYTYNSCDSGITPNQSMTDGTSYLPSQRLPSCTCADADHPTPGTGRGAPEIDIAEVSGDWGGMGLGVATQSFQVAPFDIFYLPNYEYMENPHPDLSVVNTYTGGPFQQAVSTTSMLNHTWYDGAQYQKFAFEYVPGADAAAFIAWTIADVEMMRFDARAIGPNGNVGQRLVSEEPMSLILNLGLSPSWVDIDWAALRFPTVLRVDYVRWYQRAGEEMVSCDPPGYETTEWIARHRRAYDDANLTSWSAAGFEWPRNELMHGCGGRDG